MGQMKELRTDDLAMATFLNLNGHRHKCLEMKDRRSAQWVFVGNGTLDAAASEYHDATARVEPLAFSRELRVVRDELYQFVRRNTSRR